MDTFLSLVRVLSNTSSFSWSVFELVLLLFEREPTDGIGSPPIELRITQSYPSWLLRREWVVQLVGAGAGTVDNSVPE